MPILVDVKNAFNTAFWHLILKNLREKNIDAHLVKVIADYLRDREVMIDREDSLKITRGVRQGSVLGPVLWNVLYDPVLELKVPTGTTLIAYADDLAVVVEGDTQRELQYNGNITLDIIDRWMIENRLELAPDKT